jgi:hypothetical protein
LQFFNRKISRLLISQEGAHAACFEAMATSLVGAENAATTGLLKSINGLLAEV